MSFNVLNKTLVTSLDDAAIAAQLLINIVTPDNAYDVVAISEAFGLGISDEIKARSESMEMVQLESEENPEDAHLDEVG